LIFEIAATVTFPVKLKGSRGARRDRSPCPWFETAAQRFAPAQAGLIGLVVAAPLPDSFASSPYNSLNAFRFIDAQSQVKLVRWTLVPEQTGGEIDKSKMDSLPKNLLFDDLRARLSKGPLHWRLMIVLSSPGDAINDDTKVWAATDQQVEVGTLTVAATQPEDVGQCRDFTFDPTILPTGVKISDDPILPARSVACAVSFKRRAWEGPRPSAQASAPPSVPPQGATGQGAAQ
jgi:catalase